MRLWVGAAVTAAVIAVAVGYPIVTVWWAERRAITEIGACAYGLGLFVPNEERYFTRVMLPTTEADPQEAGGSLFGFPSVDEIQLAKAVDKIVMIREARRQDLPAANRYYDISACE